MYFGIPAVLSYVLLRLSNLELTFFFKIYGNVLREIFTTLNLFYLLHLIPSLLLRYLIYRGRFSSRGAVFVSALIALLAILIVYPLHSILNRRGGGVERISLLTYYPAMKWALLLVLFVNATRIASAYRQWGMAGAFTSKALYWGLASLLIYWYFARRNPGNGTLPLIDHFLPDVAIPSSLPYWIFLLGWIFATFNLNDISIWVRWGEEFLRQYEYAVDCSAFLSLALPRTPPFLKLLGGILSTVMGGLLLFDMLLSKAMKRS